MKRVLVAIALAILALQPCAARAEAPLGTVQSAALSPDRLQRFEDFVKAQMASDQTVGVTVGFVKDGVEWSRGYGYADLENKVPAGPQTAYRLASVSKSLTALAVVQLAERGKINLDAEVQTYVPYFPRKPWPVTVRQVLGHLGGISHYKGTPDELHIKVHKTTREAIAIFENFDLVAEPGTAFHYSSYGYNLLAAVVEGASGTSFGDYMRDNIWLPLGMRDTRLDDPTAIIPNRARGYRLIGSEVANSEFVDISSRLGAGGTRSTVPDLLKYAEGVMAGKLVSADSWKMIGTSMVTKGGEFTDYGMGWSTSPLAGRYCLSHSGGQEETRTLLYILPREHLALAVAMNFEGGDPGVYLGRLFEAVTGSAFEQAIYAGDRASRAIYNGTWDVFNDGFAYYDQNGTTRGKTDAETAEAFAYFNRAADRAALVANRTEALKPLVRGRQPAAGEPFEKVGSYMASRLGSKLGATRLAGYPSAGVFAFFNDYVELYRKDASIPKTMRFTPAFEQLVAQWHAGWTRTNTPETRDLLITAANVDDVGRRLRALCAGAAAYPEYYWQLSAVTRQGLTGGKPDVALSASKLAADLYPDMSASNGLYGMTLVAVGRSADAMPLLKKSLEINPDGLTSSEEMNGAAYTMRNAGKLDAGIALLKVALELHPKDANLYDSLGEFYLAAGQKDLSLEAYRKALAIDPNLKTSLDAVKKLTGE
jgi:CubicO group peptidase (beta-lactamase class C family)